MKPLRPLTLCALLGVVAALASMTGRTSGATSRECPREEPIASRAISSVVTSKSSDRLYVITRSGTMYVTNDRLHWVRRQQRVPGWVITSLGTQRDLLYAGASTGLFVSTDLGRSWRVLACGWIVTGVSGVIGEPRTLYVATATTERTGSGGGVFRTRNEGTTWRRLTNFVIPGFSSRSVGVVLAGPVSPRTVLVGTEDGGILASSDGGDHWRFSRMHDEGPAVAGPQLTSLAFGRGPKHQLWAGSRREGIYSGDPLARSWVFKGFRGRWVDQVMPDPRRANVVMAVTGGRAVRSVDAGRLWRRITGLPSGVDGFVVQPKSGTIFAWAGRTVFASGDHGLHWSRLPALPPA
jgi:photosystem II stability/assembly factor-like uncharacterized protein